MNRQQIGSNPVIAKRDTETYLDFVEGVFSFLPTLNATLSERSTIELAAYKATTGREPQNVEDGHHVLDLLPIMQARNRIRRDVQEMKYTTLSVELHEREEELKAELDRYDRIGPGSVEYDPTFAVPDYATREIHLMPGGYIADPLAGYLYHYGTKVFFAGKNDEDEIHRRGVEKLPLPADGQVRRILDIGCSSGQSATALKQRFPEAEVWGIDVGVPMIRYAHKRAVDMGLDVHFAQRLAERTGFPDNHFDLVHSFIVFHELPPDIADAVAEEASRILRPGGLFLVTDFQTRDVKRGDGAGEGLVGEITRDIDARHNCEPYSWDFTHSDFGSMLRRHFSPVEVRTKGYGMPLRVATKRA